MPVFALLRGLLLTLAVSLLSGCAALSSAPPLASPSREALDHFALEGRFSLYHESRSVSGRLSWVHRGASSEVLLSSPFGQGMAEIVTDARGAQLKSADGKVFVAPDVETLTQDVLGYPLPLEQLADWVRGRVPPGATRFDALGRAERMQQADWQVEYGYGNDDPGSPPIRIIAKRAGAFELRLFVQEWRSLSSEESSGEKSP
jgi:outer membrane lipoprotein LolB